MSIKFYSCFFITFCEFYPTESKITFLSIVPPQFDASGNMNPESSHVIAAMVMAISELNFGNSKEVGIEFPTLNFQMALVHESSNKRRTLSSAY